MNKLTVIQKNEALDNAMRSFKFPEKYFICPAAVFREIKFAIASFGEIGDVNIHSIFMTYDEMNCYLKGYYNAINNPLKQ